MASATRLSSFFMILLLIFTTTFTHSANAASVDVTIRNVLLPGGLSATPFWIAAHDGQFDTFNSGGFASSGLETLAETGGTGILSSDFSGSASGLAGGKDTTIASTNGNAVPTFDPGEETTFTFDVGDSSLNQYFSFASMIIPTNDLFVGNGNPTAYQIFDNTGQSTGPLTIQIFGRDIYDAGTESNNVVNGGAAFLITPGPFEVSTTNPISEIFVSDPSYIASINGSITPVGSISQIISPDTLIAEIEIAQIPEPATMSLMGLSGLYLIRKRKRLA